MGSNAKGESAEGVVSRNSGEGPNGAVPGWVRYPNRHEDEMQNIASILGFLLPSSLCVSLVLSLKHELNATTSGEVAAGLIVGGTAMVLGLFALSCIPNLICILVAVQRKETLWKLSAFGMPLCGVLTTLTVALLK